MAPLEWKQTWKVGLPKEDGWYIWLNCPGCGCCIDDTGVFHIHKGLIYYFKEPSILPKNPLHENYPHLLEIEGKPYPQQWIKIPEPDLS